MVDISNRGPKNANQAEKLKLSQTQRHKAESHPLNIVAAIRQGKCHQFYGISDFNQNARLSGIKFHEKYQEQYKKDSNSFRKLNGEFTDYVNQMKWC
mmetsp:Transcript_2433/g.4119  ORF Transcript_2433/g.4119 Transcript_2433/m.4119 type:complete len:97 (+) Transcript_2433:741-1031(+)